MVCWYKFEKMRKDLKLPFHRLDYVEDAAADRSTANHAEIHLLHRNDSLP